MLRKQRKKHFSSQKVPPPRPTFSVDFRTRNSIEAPRSEFVYVALLQRKGLDRKYRVEALEGLAAIRKTDSLTELLAGLEGVGYQR